MRLGKKLVLSSAVLLALPWLAYRSLEAMEAFVVEGQQRGQRLAVRAVAAALHERGELFDPANAPLGALGHEGALYAYPLSEPPRIDGYAGDWGELTGRMVHHGEAHLLSQGDGPPSVAFDLVLGRHTDHLYALLEVEDDRLVYRHPGYRRLDHNDQLRLTLVDPEGVERRLLITTEGPGSVSVYAMDRRWRYAETGRPLWEMTGWWQERAGGYRVELRIPLELLGPAPRLRLAVADVDDEEERRVTAVVGSLPSRWSAELNRLVLRSDPLERLLAQLKEEEARIRVVDRQRRVRAAVGDDGLTERLPEALVGEALAGAEAVRRTVDDDGGATLTATAPVRLDGEVVGAVVLEQPRGAPLPVQLRTLLEVASATLIAGLATIAGLLLFAGRLAWRIRRLGHETEAAIDAEGRPTDGALKSELRSDDELGALARNIDAILIRLRRYTGFLENIPRTLRHEINNPLNTISTSLQNLADAEPAAAGSRYLESAERGVARLGRIMQSLTEAASLEQALRGDPRHPFDLAALTAAYVESVTLQHPGRAIRYAGPAAGITVEGADLRIEQLLDKLLANAVEFTPEGGAIEVALQSTDGEALLTVTNDGPPIPEAIRGQLFDSMVSARANPNPETPHLGIGLFVARTIAEHHGGRMEAANRPDGNGAAFTLRLPR